MAELSGLQIFKYLPAASKCVNANCKKCGFPTCMSFALKLAKGQADISKCAYATQELIDLVADSLIKPQKEVSLGKNVKIKVGGENVLFRHEKTFMNKTAIAVVLDSKDKNFDEKLQRILDFEISRVNETFRVDLVYLKGDVSDVVESKIESRGIAVVHNLDDLAEIYHGDFTDTLSDLTYFRFKAIEEKAPNYASPTYVYFKKSKNILDVMARASYYICKYANLLVFEDFDEAMFSTLMTLRQNIYTDPQKPLQVESKIYEFNNPQDDAIVFLTTNFALTYFAVANELESLDCPSYLVVTPSDGMSVLTAWSAEKFTASMVAKTVRKLDLASKIKTMRIIIPGLLAHMKEDIQDELPEYEIIVGTIEAYKIKEFVKNLSK